MDADKEYGDALPELDGEFQAVVTDYDCFVGKKQKNQGQKFHKFGLQIVGPHSIGAKKEFMLSEGNPQESETGRAQQWDRFKENVIKLKIKGFKPSEAETLFMDCIGQVWNVKFTTPDGYDRAFCNLLSIELDENGEPVTRAVAGSSSTPF